MVYLGLFLAFISSIPCFYVDWKSKSPMVLLWLLNIPFVYIPFYFFISSGFFNSSIFIEAANFIVLSHIFYFTLVMLFENNKSSSYELELSDKRWKDGLIYLVGFSILLILIFNGVDIQSFLDSDLTSKRELGGWYIVLLGLSAFLFSQFIYSYENKKNILSFFIFFIFVVILLYFRSRSIIGLFFLPLFFYVLFFKPKKRYILVLMVPFIFILSQFIKAIRYQGSLSNSIESGGVQNSFSEILSKNFTTGDLSIISVYFQVIDRCAISVWCGSYTFFQKILNKFYFWDFDGKTIEYELYDNLVTGGVGGSLHPTSYGYAYADAGGFFGVLYFGILFFSRLLIHKILLTSKYNYLYFGFIMYFILFFSRGSIYNGFFFLILVVFLDVFLVKGKKFLLKKY